MKFVAERSLEEVARDLGDLRVMELCRNRNVYGWGSTAFWATALPRNLLFLRLVEEGREDPDRVSRILKESIRAKLKSIQAIRKEQDSTQGGLPQAIYESALPAQFAIAGAFCALANMDRLRDREAIALLDAWIAGPQPLGYEARDIQLWLIDQYFGSLEATTDPHAAAHREIANGRTLVTARKTFSKWHQTHDAADWLAKDGDANEKLETLEILGIATKIPFAFPETVRMEENFHDHIQNLIRDDGPERE